MGETGNDVDEWLPPYLAERPPNRVKWLRPTAWLLGTQLAASLRDLIWSATAPSDPRDWMDPRGELPSGEIDLSAGDGPMWIDYLSDTGDSARAVYRLAYLLEQPALTVFDALDRPILVDDERLPRGELLVIGGDIAYPVSTPTALLERVRAPMIWARQTLRDTEHEVVDTADRPSLDPSTPPVLAVPGNHDLYNGLAGFVEAFRAVVPATDGAVDLSPTIAGYRRLQHATYFAARLRHGWQVLGLDVDSLTLDERQRVFFATLPKSDQRIVVTSKPAFVYYAPSAHADKLAAIACAVGLELPSLRDGKLLAAAGERQPLQLDLSGDVHTYERYWGSEHTEFSVAGESPTQNMVAAVVAKPPPVAFLGVDNRGREAAAKRSARRVGNETLDVECTPDTPSYASVVSGLGGAFHHPAQVRLGARAPVRSWPPVPDSADRIAAVLMRPRKMFQAGAVGVVGMVVAAVFMALTFLSQRQGSGTTADRSSTLALLNVPLVNATWAQAREPLWHLALIAMTILVPIVGLMLAVAWRGFLLRNARAWQTGTARLRGWTALSHRLTTNVVTWWCLRWVGGDRFVVWRTLLTAPAWILGAAALASPIVQSITCPELRHAADGFLPLYLIAAVLFLAMIVVGAAVAPAEVGVVAPGGAVRRRKPAWYARVLFALFALVTAGLILWTPYAWALLFVHLDAVWCWALTFFLYWPLRHIVGLVFRLGVWWRRFLAPLCMFAIAAGYVMVPISVAGDHAVVGASLPWWAIAAAAFFGAYFSCLWLGWYFLVCLQWNAHGNEAGGAARLDEYSQFLRVKLTADAAEVWVIAAQGPRRDAPTAARLGRLPAFFVHLWRRGFRPDLRDLPVRARLIDHFQIARTRASTSRSEPEPTTSPTP